MAKNRLAGRRVAVIGLGREGIELVRFLTQQRAIVTVLDGATRQKLGTKYLEAKKLGADFILGGDYLKSLIDFEIVFRSPGISLLQPEFRQVVKKGVEISSTTRLFFELCPAKIVGITGSKGKSTTTSLIYHLLKGTNPKVYLAGNIGYSPIPLLSKLKKTDWVVLELSSFQLEDLPYSPQLAVMLNVVPEHLDRHKTYGKYLLAKQNIYKHQKKSDVLVASKDFGPTKLALQQAKGKTCPISTKQVLKKGIYLTDGEIIYRDIKTGRRQVVAPLSVVKLRGEHMLENVLPAIGVALVVGTPIKRIAGRLKTFQPLHHRLEVVRTIGKTVFVNDSLGTTPEAVMAAILAYNDMPKAMIIGGVPKGGDFRPLIKTIAQNGVVYVALIGMVAKKLKVALKKMAPRVRAEIHPTLKSAVQGGYQAVRQGGAVILSPGAMSFDMFKDAYDRGDQFTKIVKKM